jgi:hypothetical protein
MDAGFAAYPRCSTDANDRYGVALNGSRRWASPRRWLLLGAGVLVLSTSHRVRDFVRIDGCLDRDGVFDYTTEQCLTGPTAPLHLPTRSYGDRHPLLARLSVIGPWLSLAALGSATFLAVRQPPHAL